MKFVIILILQFVCFSNLFGQDCKFRTSDIAIPIKPKDEIKKTKKLCIYERDTSYWIKFKRKSFHISNVVLTNKLIKLVVSDFSKGYRETNIVHYSRLDTNNLTKQKLIDYSDLLRLDTVDQRIWLFVKKNPDIIVNIKNAYSHPDSDDFFELGLIKLIDGKWVFEMNEKFQEILFINDKYISTTWTSRFNEIILKE